MSEVPLYHLIVDSSALQAHGVVDDIVNFVRMVHLGRSTCHAISGRWGICCPLALKIYLEWRGGQLIPPTESDFFIDNLLVRILSIIEMVLVDRPCAMGV